MDVLWHLFLNGVQVTKTVTVFSFSRGQVVNVLNSAQDAGKFSSGFKGSAFAGQPACGLFRRAHEEEFAGPQT